jgi:hypothetical protein
LDKLPNLLISFFSFEERRRERKGRKEGRTGIGWKGEIM